MCVKSLSKWGSLRGFAWLIYLLLLTWLFWFDLRIWFLILPSLLHNLFYFLPLKLKESKTKTITIVRNACKNGGSPITGASIFPGLMGNFLNFNVRQIPHSFLHLKYHKFRNSYFSFSNKFDHSESSRRNTDPSLTWVKQQDCRSCKLYMGDLFSPEWHTAWWVNQQFLLSFLLDVKPISLLYCSKKIRSVMERGHQTWTYRKIQFHFHSRWWSQSLP